MIIQTKEEMTKEVKEAKCINIFYDREGIIGIAFSDENDEFIFSIGDLDKEPDIIIQR